MATGVLGRSYAVSGPLLNWLLMLTDSIPFRLISRLGPGGGGPPTNPTGSFMCVGVPHFDPKNSSPIEIVTCKSQPFQKSMVDWHFKLASPSDGNRSANLGSAVKIQLAFPANDGFTGAQGQSGSSNSFCVDAGPPPPTPPPAQEPTWNPTCGDFQVVQPKTLAKGNGCGWGLQANMVPQDFTTTVTDCASTCCANGGRATCRTWQWRDKGSCGKIQQGIYTPYDDVAGLNATVYVTDEACQDRCDAIPECLYWTRFQSSGWCHLSGSLSAVHTTAPPSQAAHCGTCPKHSLHGCYHGLNVSPGGLNASIPDGGNPWLTAVVAESGHSTTTTTRAPTRRPTAPPGPRPPAPPRPKPQPQKHNDDHGMSEEAELDVLWFVLASLAVFFVLVFVNVFVLSRNRRAPGPRSETAQSNRSFDNLVGIPGTESAAGAGLGTKRKMTQGTQPVTLAVGAPNAAGAADAVTAARPRLADETTQAAAAMAAMAAAADAEGFWGLGIAGGIPQSSEPAVRSPSPVPAEIPAELVQPRFKVITVNMMGESQSIGLDIKDTEGGLVIADVVPGGAAAAAGIEAGQLLVSVNGNLAMTMGSAECMAIVSSASITVTFVVVHVTGAGFESPVPSPEALEPLSKPSKRARVSPSAALTNTGLTMVRLPPAHHSYSVPHPAQLCSAFAAGAADVDGDILLTSCTTCTTRWGAGGAHPFLPSTTGATGATGAYIRPTFFGPR